MAFKPFKHINVTQSEDITTKTINNFQDNVSAALGQLLGKDALDVTLLTNIVLLPNTINKVPHKLGRRLSGWIVVRNHGSYAVLTDMQDINKAPELLLWLSTPTTVTVDLIVF